MRPDLSVIVPARGRWAMTRECLEALRRNTPARHEAIVVDGGLLPALPAYARRAGLRVVGAPRPASFARAVNAGMRAARGAVLVWLNNDARVTPGWSEALCAALAAPGVGAAGPRLAAPGPGDADAAGAAWALRHGGRVSRVPLLGGACLALRREAAEATGLLDERLVWGEEDDDYCFRLRQGGWRLVRAEGALVFHRSGASRGALSARRRASHRRANAAVLKDKWVAEAGRIRRDLAGVLR